MAFDPYRAALVPEPASASSVTLDDILDEFQVSDAATRERVLQLAQLESGGNMAARGPKLSRGMHAGTQARGALQIMPKTAQGYPQYDLNDPADATRAGLHYFLDNLNDFGGDLDAATVAHHAGPGGARRWLKNGSAGTRDLGTGLSTDDYLLKVSGGRRQQAAQAKPAGFDPSGATLVEEAGSAGGFDPSGATLVEDDKGPRSLLGTEMGQVPFVPSDTPADPLQVALPGAENFGNQAAEQSPAEPKIGSVMDGFEQGPVSRTGPPVSQQSIDIFRRQYDTHPDKRAAMMQLPGWQGDLARQIHEEYAAQDAKLGAPGADPLRALASPDLRHESQTARNLQQGMDRDTAAMTATSQAAGGDYSPVQQASESDFDFELRDQAKDETVGVRAARKGAAGIKQGYLGVLEAAADLVGAEEASRRFGGASRDAARTIDAVGEGEGFDRYLEGAVTSIAQQLPTLVGSAIAGGPALALGGMALQSFGQEYSEGKRAKLDNGDAATRAALFAAFEVIGESLSIGHLMQGLRGSMKGASAAELLDAFGKYMVRELPGEVLTTTGQFLTDKVPAFGLNREAGWKEYARQVGDTILQTVLQTGMMGAGAGATSAAVRAARGQRADATTDLGFDPRGIDAAARAAFNPDNAQLHETNRPEIPNAQAPQMDAARDQGGSDVGGGSAELAPDGAGSVAGGSAVAGPVAPGSGTGLALGAPAGESAAGVAPPLDPLDALLLEREAEAIASGDPIEVLVTQAEAVAVRAAAQPAAPAEAAPIDQDALLAEVESLLAEVEVEPRADGTVMVRGEGAAAAVKAAVPDAPTLRGANGAVLVSARFGEQMLNAVTAAKHATAFRTQQGQPLAAQSSSIDSIASANAAPSSRIDATDDASVPVLQNRDRSTAASVAQMQAIASNPDYGRLGFSRDFANGAPVVAGGNVPSAQIGKTDVAVAADGRRIPVQYAVVEAADVLTSNAVDGTPNVTYGDAAVTGMRAIAGNGRIAGLQQAHRSGTAATYVGELTDDALHGINPDVIRGMRAPVLVRVMPAGEVTANIGDVSNTSGNLGLSPVEQAANDRRRVNLDVLQFADDGSITPEAVRQFVRAMPQAEQGGLIDTNGQPTKQAVDRLHAAVFSRAYGNDQLVRLYAQAQDPEARNVLSALAQAAPNMARLEGAGALDIRSVVAEAAEIAVNARREGRPLAQAAQQMDLAADPDVGVVLELFAANPRSVRTVADALNRAASFAYTEAHKPDEDMFGAVPRADRASVINQLRPQHERGSEEDLEVAARRQSVEGDAGRRQADARASTDVAATESGRSAQAAAAEEVGARPPPMLMSNGKPFASEKLAASSARQRKLDMRPVPVEGGWGLVPSLSVQQPQRGYTARKHDTQTHDLFGDPYELIETRPGSTDRQLETGRAAMAAAERILGPVGVRGAGRTLLGSAISRDFRQAGGTTLVGKRVESAADLAALAQILRDPRFETFRVFYTDANGEIVGEAAYSSRLPAAVYMPEGFDSAIRADKDRFEASNFWVLHNHPSGRATPSEPDRALTRHIGGIDGFSGHVVIDHNEYSLIDAAGNGGSIHAPELASVDLKADPEKSHPLLKQKIDGPATAARLAKALQVKDGYAVIVGASNVGDVQLLVEVPIADLMQPKTLSDQRRALARLRRATRETGIGNLLFAVVPGSLSDARYSWLRNSASQVFTDVLDASGTSFLSTFPGASSGRIPETRRQQSGMRVREGDAQYRDTERAYGGREGYERAKAAGRTKLNYRQWVQVRTPAFKAWFGDWEAVRAQKRLDAMKPMEIRIPDEWAGLGVPELRSKVEVVLREIAESGRRFQHPEIGAVDVGKRAVKKMISSSPDPAKLLLLGDVQRAFEASVFASSEIAEDGKPNVVAYEKLLSKISVGGARLSAVFAVERLRDGRQLYNAVTLEDEQEKTPVASPRDTPEQIGERATSAITGVLSFVRHALRRVNPASVSKVTDPDTGEPLVVYHGTNVDFSIFRPGEGMYGNGVYLAIDPEYADGFADAEGGNVMPLFAMITGNGDGRLLWDKRGGIFLAARPEQVKSATSNNGAFGPEENDVRFSFAGPRAETADRHALESAQQRIEAGEDAEAVRQDTGWHRGADGKWRFEINDADAWYDPDALVEMLEKAKDEGRAFDPIADQLPLDHVLDHPALFAAYPALSDVGVVFVPRDWYGLRGSAGAYSASMNAIVLADDLSVEHTLSILLHEVQHNIQYVEGFATGGSSADAFADPRVRPGASREGLDAAHRLLNERLASMAAPMPIEQFAREAWGQTELSAELRASYDEYVRDVTRASAAPEMARAAQSWAAKEWYRRLAGEVEARNTQSRQRLTDAERRATPPSATADVADSDVIVTFNGKDAHSAPPPANAGPLDGAAAATPTAVAVTRDTLRESIAESLPSLAGAVDRMLARGDEGKRGGLVLIESASAEAIAQAYASKTGRSFEDARRALDDEGDGAIDTQRSDNGDIQGFFDPQSGVTFLVAPNLTSETAPAVLLHEATHGRQRAEIDARALALIEARSKAVEPVREFLDRVAERMEAAGETGNAAEATAYIVEEAMLAGRQRGFSAIDGKFMNWLALRFGKRITDIVRDFVAMVRGFGLKIGVPLNPSVDDLVAIAKSNVRAMARGEADGQAGESRSAMKDIDANIRRGEAAMNRAILDRADQNRAMYREQIGWVDFVWGDERKGVQHIMLRRMESDGMSLSEVQRLLTGDLVKVIATGHVVRRNDSGKSTRLVLGMNGVEAVLVRRQGSNAWMLTGFGLKPVVEGRGATPSSSTQAAPIRSRRELGAGLDETVPSTTNNDKPRFSRSGNASAAPAASKPQAAFPTPVFPEGPTKKKLEQKRYEFQDRLIDLKKIQASIVESGRTIRDEFNPYMAETLMYGKAAYKVQGFLEGEINPVLSLMRAANISVEQLNKYLHARHAAERNAAMAALNPNQDELNDLIQDAADTLDSAELALQQDPNSGLLLGDVERARAKLKALKQAKPWSGTEEDRHRLSGMSDAEAKTILDGAHAGAKAPVFKKIGERIDRITAKTRSEMTGYGLESAATVGVLDNTYQHYVPLKRDMGESDLLDSMGGTGQGLSIRGSQLKAATGSLREVENIFANLVAQREATIVRGEKNRVAKSLYGLVLEHPNPELFTVIRPGMPEKRMRAELAAMGLGEDTVDSLVAAPRKPYINPKTGLVEQRVSPNYLNLGNAVVLRVNGEDRVVLFNRESDTAMRLVRALRNDDNDYHGFSKMLMDWFGPATRYLSAINTQYNPVFGLTNFVRDVQGAAINLESTEIAGKQAQLMKAIPSAMAAAKSVERGDKTHKWASLYDEFLADGGATGFRDQYASMEARAKAIERDLSQTGFRNARGVKQTFDLLSDFNTVIENATRFAAYKVARDAGMSRPKAADLAKDITVNFNRKGARSGAASALYMFFNAGAQSVERTIRVINSPRGRKIVGGLLSLGVMQAVMGIMALGDDWDDIPEHERARHLIIPAPWRSEKEKYIKIPLPLSWNAIPNLSRTVVEMAYYRTRLGERTLNLLATTVDAFNPLGSSDLLSALAPSVMDPLVEMARNENFTGRKIEREDFSSLAPTPGWTRAKEETAAIFKALSYSLNWISSGGKKYEVGLVSPTPEMLSYMFGVVSGGLGREIDKATSFVEAVVRGDDVPTYKIPVVSRFYGEAGGDAVLRARYYSAIKDINEASFALKRTQDDNGDAAEYYARASLAKMARGAQNHISDLQKQRRETSDREERKLLDDEIRDTQQDLVREFDAAEN